MYAPALYLPSEVEGTVGMMRLLEGFHNLCPMSASSERVLTGSSGRADWAIGLSEQIHCAKMAGNRLLGTQVNSLPPCGSMG